MDFKIKVNVDLLSVQLQCIKCRNKDFRQIKEDVENKVSYSLEEVVFEERKCEDCGCNTFDVDMEIEVITETN